MSSRDRFTATYLLSEKATRRRKKRHKSGSEFSYYTDSERSFCRSLCSEHSRSKKGHLRAVSSPLLQRTKLQTPSTPSFSHLENFKDVVPDITIKDYKERKRRKRQDEGSASHDKPEIPHRHPDELSVSHSNNRKPPRRVPETVPKAASYTKTTTRTKRDDQSDSSKRRSGEKDSKKRRSDEAKSKRRLDESSRSKRRSDESNRSKRRSDKNKGKRRSNENKNKRRSDESSRSKRRSKENKRRSDESNRSKRRSDENKQRASQMSTQSNIESVKTALDEDYEKKKGSPEMSDTQETIGSIETIEALNLIDERLLEDIDPRKLSRLKADAERKHNQSQKKLRRKWHTENRNGNHEVDILDVQTFGAGFRSHQLQRIINLIPQRPQAMF